MSGDSLRASTSPTRRTKKGPTVVSPPAGTMRDIQPLGVGIAERFCDNTVVNSRYTIYNFIFKNLYEQFRRPLNFYFLLVAMLQFISVIAPVNPLSTLLPLALAFSMTAAKEGYDDVKRHRNDAAYNSKMRTVLDVSSREWRQKPNSAILVGDMVLIHQNEDVPCDVVPLAATSRIVYIRTDNLDGEIDLKPRDVLPSPLFYTTEFASPLGEQVSRYNNNTSSSSRSGSLFDVPGRASSANTREAQKVKRQEDETEENEKDADAAYMYFNMQDSVQTLMTKAATVRLCCPPPSMMLDAFDGYAEFSMQASRGDSGTLVKVPLTHQNLLPQSCLIKNTEALIGVAIYTGEETKCGMNKHEPAAKWAKIDQDVSRYSIIIFCCQLISAAVFGFVGYNVNRDVGSRYWYLPKPAMEAGASLVIYPLRFFLLTSVMIPVSFKLVVDVSKYYMTMVVEWDASMQHNTGGTGDSGGGCCVRNSSIIEDLGQIDYVLADKTGTMTQNVMELKFVSIGPNISLNVAELDLPRGVYGSPTTGTTTRPPATAHAAETAHLPANALARSTSSIVVSGRQNTMEYISREDTLRKDHSFLPVMGGIEVTHFATLLALCNTVDVEAVDEAGLSNDYGSDGDHRTEAALLVSYQAASPDEVALCCGACKLGARLVSRDARHAVVEVDGVTTEWVVHYVFPFSSEKKSMGVIMENPDTGLIYLFIKGADDRVAAMMAHGNFDGVTSTVNCEGRDGDANEMHLEPAAAKRLNSFFREKLETYAMTGLRTLLVAQKLITREELAEFMKEVRVAEVITEGRQQHLDALRARMECGLEIIGITAIEDRLQENVRETISDIVQAGVKVWMLTGDKVETAEQIGLSCGLYNPGDCVIKIVEGDTKNSADDWESVLMSINVAHLQNYNEDLHVLSPASQDFPVSNENLRSPFHYGVPASAYVPPQVLPPNSIGHQQRRKSSASSSTLNTRQCVLIVQGGRVLDRIMSSETLSRRFAEVSAVCVSVICARTTPSQKAAVTTFVRDRGNMTLSIGDGGNDVAMLQVAHVGVGIMGKEGQQAARAADFSITRFSDLRPLMFVHRQQAYTRTAYIIKYSFYKSMLIAFVQLVYNAVGTYCSGATFWNSYALTMWNGAYTLPPTMLYCLDRCAPRVTLEGVPALYKLGRRNVDMNPREFFSFVARGVIQSILALWLATSALSGGFAFPGKGDTAPVSIVFTVCYTALILTQFVTVLFESHSVTLHNAMWVVAMPILYLLTTLAFSGIPQLQFFGVMHRTLSAEIWLIVIGVCGAVTVPFVMYLVVRAMITPNGRDTLREKEVRALRARLQFDPSYRRIHSFLVRWMGCVPEPRSTYTTAKLEEIESAIVATAASSGATREGDISAVI